jgi:hypothetical protein
MIVTAGLFIGGAGVLGLAGPAFAATGPPAGTPVTVEITGGDLNISAPTATVDLGTAVGSSSGQDITGKLGEVLVSDQRAGVLGWTASAGATDFTGSATGSTPISASTVTYAAGAATVVGTSTVTPTDLTAMDTEGAVQTASDVVGDNTASWNPSIKVPVPAHEVAGTFGATITHSVT